MFIRLDTRLTLADMPKNFRPTLITKLSFPNPKFLESKRMGRWLGDTLQYLEFYEDTADGFHVPRGFINQFLAMCKKYRVRYFIEDNRRTFPQVDFEFNGELRPFQAKAVNDVLRHQFGTLSAPTGSGKTVMALHVIAERRQPTLIVVHTRELQNQWIDRIQTFLGIPPDEVGVIGNGKRTVGEKITVALVQTLYKCAYEVSPKIGFLIVDECHRTPSRTFTEGVSAFDSKYMLGLSATPWRRDKLSQLIFWHLGDVVHTIRKRDLIESGDILSAEVVTRQTDFTTLLDPSAEYSKVVSELTRDTRRNQLIANDVISETRNGNGVCLVLSDRKQHCEDLRDLLRARGLRPALLTGDVSGKVRDAIVEQLNNGETRILIATGQLIGEGFDCHQLSTLFMATPIKFDGRVMQYLGRILRPAAGKRARVFDYQDMRVGPLKASAKARQKVYRQLQGKGPSEGLQAATGASQTTCYAVGSGVASKRFQEGEKE